MRDLAERTHRRMLALVAALAVGTVTGMVLLWPATAELPDVEPAPDALASGVIVAVERYQGEPDPRLNSSGEMAIVSVDVRDGPEAGQTVQIDTPTEGYPTFDVGDRVTLSRSQLPGGDIEYFITDFQRLPALLWLVLLFVAAVLVVGRWQGLRSLLGLALSLLVVTRFIVPAILVTDNSPFAVALVGALAVMLVTLYLAHGVNEMTTSAVLGTTVALGVTVALAWLFIEQAELTGFSSEEATFARFAVAGLDLRGLVLAGLIVAALGVLDDVTVSQASTVFALHDTDPSLSWRQLTGRALKVGRDHIASTVNTLFLAYAGASLALLVLFSTGGLPLGEIVNSEILAEEIVKTIVGSLGLISAMPLTTALAATVAVRRPVSAAALRARAYSNPGAAVRGVPADDAAAHRSWARYLGESGQDGGAVDAGLGPREPGNEPVSEPDSEPDKEPVSEEAGGGRTRSGRPPRRSRSGRRR